MKTFTFELLSGQDIEFVIGQNARENTQIIQESSPQDIWVHAGDGVSSCHVIAQLPDDDSIEITKRDRLMIAKKGAVLCKENTNKLKMLILLKSWAKLESKVPPKPFIFNFNT